MTRYSNKSPRKEVAFEMGIEECLFRKEVPFGSYIRKEETGSE